MTDGLDTIARIIELKTEREIEDAVSLILSMGVPPSRPNPPRFRIYIGNPATRKHVIKGRNHYQSFASLDSDWKTIKKEMGRLSSGFWGTDYTKGLCKPMSIDGMVVDTPHEQKIIVQRINI